MCITINSILPHHPSHCFLSVRLFLCCLFILQELVDLDYNTEACCELWKNLHTSPDLNRLVLPIPTCRFIPCDLEPLPSVQVLETKSSSIQLPIVLINLPSLQKLLLHSDVSRLISKERTVGLTFFVVHILQLCIVSSV